MEIREKVLAKMDDNSVDSIVTDPPYGLSFMGKKWDYDVPSVELWRQVFRVLKPVGICYPLQVQEHTIEWLQYRRCRF